MLPSFKSFSSSNLRSSANLPNDDDEPDRSDNDVGAPVGTAESATTLVSRRERFTLPPLGFPPPPLSSSPSLPHHPHNHHHHNHQQQQQQPPQLTAFTGRPYSNSLPTRTTSPPSNNAFVGRKRSHEMASRHDLSDDNLDSASLSNTDRPHSQNSMLDRDPAKGKHKLKPRSSKTRLADVDERDLADAEDGDDERPRPHPALVRVKVEDRDDSPRDSNASPSPMSYPRRPHPSSPPDRRRLSISTSSASRPRVSSPPSASNVLHDSDSTLIRRTGHHPSPVPPPSSNASSSASNLKKKRRVTVSGTSYPSSSRSVHNLTGTVNPISPIVMGFNVPGTPEAVDQIRSTLTVKQQQKALIDARRGASYSVGATPEPSAPPIVSAKFENLSHPIRSQSTMSIMSVTSPVSDVTGAPSFSSVSTTGNDSFSRISSPSSSPPRRFHHPQYQLPATSSLPPEFAQPSSSAAAAARDVEMELEEQSDATLHLTRRRAHPNLAAAAAAGASATTTTRAGGPGSMGSESGSGGSGSISNPRRSRANPRLTVRTGSTEWEQEVRNGTINHSDPARFGFGTRTEGETMGIPLRSAPPSQARHHHIDIGGDNVGMNTASTSASTSHFASAFNGGGSNTVGFKGERIRRSAHNAGMAGGSNVGTFRAPPVVSPSASTFSDLGGAASPGLSRGFPTTLPPPSHAHTRMHGPSHPHPPAPPLSNTPRPVTTPVLPTFPSSTGTSPNAYDPNGPLPSTSSVTYPTPQSSFASIRQHPHLAQSGGGGMDELITKKQFVSLFGDMYDALSDSRRMRAWLDDQQQRQSREREHEREGLGGRDEDRPSHQNGFTMEDITRIVEERVRTVRDESRIEVEQLQRRIRTLEERLDVGERERLRSVSGGSTSMGSTMTAETSMRRDSLGSGSDRAISSGAMRESSPSTPHGGDQQRREYGTPKGRHAAMDVDRSVSPAPHSTHSRSQSFGQKMTDDSSEGHH